jgi:hypothetical protein
MNARAATTLFAAAVVVTAAAAVGAAETPPRDLHLVGDHWTAWDPPAEFPPGAEVYTIERGDTLWDLAAEFYGDPYLWPQLWEQNRYILDAHWIYPGDPLLLGVEVEAATTLADGSLAGEGELVGDGMEDGRGPRYLSAAEAAGPPGPLGAESDIYCSGFIGELDEAFPYRIVASEWEAVTPELASLGGTARLSYRGKWGGDTLKYGLMTGDIVYLDGGYEAGLAAGQLLTALAAGPKVHHPVENYVFGRHYRYLGRVRVLSVQPETAIAEIVHTCDPVTVGALLQPFVPEPVPLGRRTGMKPVNLPPAPEELIDAPVILSGEDGIITLAADSVVYIDRGDDGDLVPGDVYTIYRLNRGELPPVLLGELAVLSVHPRSSVGRILRSRHTIYPGDRLELK